MKILLVFLSLLMVIPQQTDTFYIVKVSGDIINTSTGKHLTRGDEILATDEIQFADREAYALVVGEKSERYKLKFPESIIDDEGGFNSMVRNSLSKSKKIRVKTRGIITNADISDLKEFLGEDEFTVIGNNLNVQLNKQEFQDQSVIMKYDKNGQKVDKELVDMDYKLNFSRKDIGVKPVGEVKLYHVDFYQKNDAQGIQNITRLDFNFIDEFDLKDELITIIGVYKKKGFDKLQMKSFLMEYFGDFYGNTHLYTLSTFVDKIIAEQMK